MFPKNRRCHRIRRGVPSILVDALENVLGLLWLKEPILVRKHRDYDASDKSEEDRRGALKNKYPPPACQTTFAVQAIDTVPENRPKPSREQ